MRPFRIFSLLFHFTNLSGCGQPLIKNVHAGTPTDRKQQPALRQGVYSNSINLAQRERVQLMSGSAMKSHTSGNQASRGPQVPELDYSSVKKDLDERLKLLAQVRPGSPLFIAKRFYTEYLRLLEELIDAEKIPHYDIDPSCPPKKMEVRMNGNKYMVNLGQYIAHGSSSEVYKSEPVPALEGKTLIIKSLAPSAKKDTKVLSAKIKLALLEDEAFMLAFEKVPGLVPHTYAWEASDIDSYCHARTIVSENVGATELGDLPKSKRTNASVMYLIAARALEIIEQIHMSGLIHGDIHKRNWLIQDKEKPAETLRIIDFGRVQLFMKPHPSDPAKFILIPDNTQLILQTNGWNASLLSPWEIKGHRPTRRDDIFRIAEMLIFMFGDPNFHSAVSVAKDKYQKTNLPQYLQTVIDLKFHRKFDASLPPKIKEFYKYAVSMRYNNKPNYQRWIREFREAAAAAT